MSAPSKKGHVIRQITLARVSCECGWFWRNDCLKGKSDDDLLLESGNEFEIHRKAMLNFKG